MLLREVPVGYGDHAGHHCRRGVDVDLLGIVRIIKARMARAAARTVG